MTVHVSARLAWHEDGWDGRVCRRPRANIHCVGQYSYPGDTIRERRDLDWEERDDVAGCHCGDLSDGLPPCAYSINAFGERPMPVASDPPEFFRSGERAEWDIPPATAVIWPMEEMYHEEFRIPDTRRYDPQERIAAAKGFFNALTPDETLIFYYANYSNPFSEEDARRYVVVGVSTLRALGPEERQYPALGDWDRDRYGGYVWGRDVTSHYPDVGFRLPYHRYRGDPDALERFLVVPANPRNFKYAARQISDDDALVVIEQLSQAVGALQEVDGANERWDVRADWLADIVGRLWTSRGLYPGVPGVLSWLKFREAIPWFKEEVIGRREEGAQQGLIAFLEGDADLPPGLQLDGRRADSVRRSWALLTPAQQMLIKHTLIRIDLLPEQIGNIIGDDREQHGFTASLAEIDGNPYIISEQYRGDGPDDTISFAKIDHAVLPSPELGGEALGGPDDSERLRALLVERLRAESQHTFAPARKVVHDVNERLSYLPEWKRHQFTERYLDVDEAVLAPAVQQRSHGESRHLYLRSVFESERFVEETLRGLANRPDIALKRPMTLGDWKSALREPRSAIARSNPGRYDEIISGQAEVCSKIFARPLCVVTGDAGTGKTTVVGSIIQAVERTRGKGAAVTLLAPTGKAADRLRERTGHSAVTVHSFLASHGWLNDNLTFRSHGQREAGSSTVVIDEASMLDIELVATLLRAIEWEAVERLILVGDVSQLPPIGRGKFFADTLDWLEDEAQDSVGRLDENIRQLENRLKDQGTAILDLAHLYIRRPGLRAEAPGDKAEAEEILRRVQAGGEVDRDLRVEYWNDPEDLEALVETLVVGDMEVAVGQSLDYDRPWELWNLGGNGDRRPANQQVLTPYRGEEFGTERLNELLQDHANGNQLRRRGALAGITYDDKVIQVRNSSDRHPVWGYDTRQRKRTKCQVFNGELGFTSPHSFDYDNLGNRNWRLRRFQVRLAGKEHLYIDMLSVGDVEDNLELAYAISVHKAQGSEFDRVYFVVPKHKQALLTTELFYTGLTRAQRHCTLLVEEDVSALLSLRRRERSQLARTNSSVFRFAPIPDELLDLRDWYQEGRIHRALSDDLVRSKSEVIIANLLHERGLPFEYEQPLFASDGTFYLPDFTVAAGGRTWYWEHWGRLDDEGYRNHMETKKAWYEQNFPGQLVETVESGKLSKDAETVIGQMRGA